MSLIQVPSSTQEGVLPLSSGQENLCIGICGACGCVCMAVFALVVCVDHSSLKTQNLISVTSFKFAIGSIQGALQD